MKPARPVAVNSNLSWSPDGSAIIVALRSAELDREARRTFKALTEGPIIVHKSSDPFLEWDYLQRSTRTRAIAELDPRTGVLLAAKDLKGLSKGEIFVQGIDGSPARSMTPRPKAAAENAPCRSAATAHECSSRARRAGTS